MRFIRFVLKGAAGLLCLLAACTSPVETNYIAGLVGAKELYFDHSEKIHLAWSPDSSKIAYEAPLDTMAGGQSSSIFVYNLQQDTSRDVTPDAHDKRNCFPTFSADSRAIIFSQNDQLFKMSLQNGETAALTSSSLPPQFNPEMSPDGQLIACDDGRDIYVVSSDSGALQNVSISISMPLRNPTWSSDGRKLACESDSQLVIFNFDHNEIIQHSAFAGQFRAISWARQETPPFGSPILFHNGAGIAMINPATGKIYDAFEPVRGAAYFCWAANGHDIAYSTPYTLFRAPLLATIERK